MEFKILLSLLFLALLTISVVSASQSWWNTSWQARQKLTFTGYPGPGSVVNFTTLVKLNSTNFNFSKAKTDGTDLRFIDADNSTILNYHFEEWNNGGESFIWVKVPAISSTTDYIWLYYNNSLATDAQNEAGTYDDNYMMVQHLQEFNASDTAIHNDSTQYGNDGTPHNFDGTSESTQNATGQIDGADEFDGSDDYIGVSDDNSLDISNALTIEVWFKAYPSDDLILDGTTEALSAGNYIYNTVQVMNSGTLSINGDVKIIARSFTVDGTSTVNGNGNGYAGGSYTMEGSGSGKGTLCTDDAGGGAGYGGAGGGAADCLTNGGASYGLLSSEEISKGSGGAGGNIEIGGVPEKNGHGGNGGASIFIWADNIVISGSIQMNGEDGTDGVLGGGYVGGGGGGGSGGGILLKGDVVSYSGQLSANGGAGGDSVGTGGTDGGGGGGGGRIKIFYDSDLTASGSLSVNVGAGGTGGTGNGNAGSTGTTYASSTGCMAPFQMVAKENSYGFGLNCGFINNGSLQTINISASFNQWHHSVLTYNGSALELYIDGSKVASKLTNGDITTGTSNLIIGSLNASTLFFNGTIDEVRISNVARSAQWINASYLSMNDQFLTYGNEETPDVTAPSIEFVTPTDPNGATISRNFTFVNVSVSDALSDTSSFIDWNRSLVGYWSFQDNATDMSVYGNDGNVQGASFIAGKFGQALEFDGVDDSVRTANLSAKIFSEFTLSTWFYSYDVGDDNTNNLVNIIYHNHGNTHLELRDFGTKVRFAFRDLENIPQDNYFNYSFSKNHWYNLVATYNGNKARLYVNGNFVGEKNTSGKSMGTENGTMYYGFPQMQDTRPFNGTIDEVHIWNRALSPEEINASYNSGVYRLYRNFTGLQDGATYEYYAYAIDEAGNTNRTETRTVTVSLIPPDVTTPSQPVLLNPSNNTYFTNQNPELNWSSVTEENFANYTLEIADVSDFAHVNYSYYTLSINDTNYTTGVLLDARWYWRVTAYDASRNSNTSDYFIYTVDTTLPTLTFNKPYAANSTLVGKWFRQNVTVTDANLWWLNCTIRNVSNNIWWSREWNLTGMLNYVVTTVVDVASWPLGFYYENCTARDLTER